MQAKEKKPVLDLPRRRCAICEREFWYTNPYAILLGEGDGKFVSTIKPLKLTKYYVNHPPARDVPLTLPGAPDKKDWNHELKTALAHTDCLLIFLRFSSGRDALDKLWTLARWQLTELPTIPQPITDTSHAKVFLKTLLDLPPSLATLPVEVIDAIHGHCKWHDFWRYLACYQLACRVSQMQWEPRSATVPLMQIKSWKRGEQAVLKGDEKLSDGTNDTILSLDSRGIAAIETAEKQAARAATPYAAYIRVNADRMEKFSIQIKCGLARLNKVPDQIFLFAQDCLVSAPSLLPAAGMVPRQIYTVDVSKCFGLTIFMSHGTIVRIHGHTASQPSAVDLTVNTAPGERENLNWIYVPLHDGLEEIGLVEAKDTTIGQFYTPSKFCLTMRRGPPIQFGYFSGERSHLDAPYEGTVWETKAYQVPKPLVTYSLTGLHWKGMGSFDRRANFVCPPTPPRFHHGVYTVASLDNVQQVHVFNSRYNSFAGMILDYRDGTRRTLGQCRLGYDRSVTIASPHQLCFARMTSVVSYRTEWEYYNYAVEVRPASDDPHTHKDEYMWTCALMKGRLQCWMGSNETNFVFEDQDIGPGCRALPRTNSYYNKKPREPYHV